MNNKRKLNEKILISPLDIRIRTCFNCKKPLHFSDYSSRNLEMDTERQLQLWQNPYLEFFCCMCYSRKELKREIKYLQHYIDSNNELSNEPSMLRLLKYLKAKEKYLEK